MLTNLHHNNDDDDKPRSKRSKTNDTNTNTNTKASRQAKVVPELIYQMEQLDLQIIKLSSYVTHKSEYSKLIRRTVSRDFKINTNKKRKANDDNDNDNDNDENHNTMNR